MDAIRITARSVATQGPRALVVDGVDVGEHFVLRAIGSPDGLSSALQRPGGIISQLQQFINATIVIRAADQLTLPATAIDLTPTAAQPAD